MTNGMLFPHFKACVRGWVGGGSGIGVHSFLEGRGEDLTPGGRGSKIGPFFFNFILLEINVEWIEMAFFGHSGIFNQHTTKSGQKIGPVWTKTGFLKGLLLQVNAGKAHFWHKNALGGYSPLCTVFDTFW